MQQYTIIIKLKQSGILNKTFSNLKIVYFYVIEVADSGYYFGFYNIGLVSESFKFSSNKSFYSLQETIALLCK